MVTVFISFGYAKQPDQSLILIRSFTFTPGYMERTFNATEMMVHCPLGLRLSAKGFDALVDGANNYKVISGLLYLLPQSWSALANNTVYHEFGHARAMASYKEAYTY